VLAYPYKKKFFQRERGLKKKKKKTVRKKGTEVVESAPLVPNTKKVGAVGAAGEKKSRRGKGEKAIASRERRY